MQFIKKISLFFIVMCFTVTSLMARDFFLGNTRTSVVYGPFRFENGLRARLSGEPYELLVHTDGRFSLKSLSNARQFGPFQAVDNRLIGLNGEMYCFNWNAASLRKKNTSSATRKSAAERAYEADSAPVAVPDLPPEPEMPARLEAPEEQPVRRVTPKNLTELPDPSEIRLVYAWLALLDRTPMDWSIASKKGKQSSIERITVGGDLSWNCWLAQVSLSPLVKSQGIIPSDDGDAKIDSGTGWSLALGYNRPFLFESGWAANAGIRGMIRQDKGDISSSSYVTDSHADTNGVFSISRQGASSSISLTELSLWVDVGLSYSYDVWGVYSDFSFQPVSEFNISGDLPYGGGKLKLDADRASPVAVQIGGWYQYEQYRFFADLTFASDTLFRIGCGFQF